MGFKVARFWGYQIEELRLGYPSAAYLFTVTFKLGVFYPPFLKGGQGGLNNRLIIPLIWLKVVK